MILGGLVTGEMAARTIAPQLPHWRGTDTDTVILTGHARRLWGLSPGQRSNLHTTAEINALGLRGPAPTQPRPPDQARLMVLGDSTFFGFGIPAGQHLLDRAAATLINSSAISLRRFLSFARRACQPVPPNRSNTAVDSAPPYRDRTSIFSTGTNSLALFA